MDIFIDQYRRGPGTVKITGNLYPVHNIDYVDVTHALTGGGLYSWPLENVDITHAMTGGTLLDALLTYANWPVENIDVSHSLYGGELIVVVAFIRYDMLVESIDVTHAFTGGSIATVLLTYSNYPVENVDVTHALTGGTLT